MEKTYRYPGIRPFTRDDRNIYFGREEDIENLSQLIFLERLVVLHAKSGMGKTSLLNAGVIPKLESEGNFQSFLIRFGSFSKDRDMSPLTVLKTRVSDSVGSSSLLDRLEGNKESLWYYFKNLQINNGEDYAPILIFDQFEEVFTYPEADLLAFKQELSNLLNGSIEKSYKTNLREKLIENRQFLSDEELEIIYRPPNVKVIFSIRSDRMSQLDKFKDYLPDILQKSYELEALGIRQAKEAILKPAQEAGAYLSVPFVYESETLQKILRFLSEDNTHRIESFQLQILCQWVEQYSIKNNDLSISPEDLGDLSQIYKNYYDDQIALIGDPEDQYHARLLIEDGLIFEPEERRLSLYEGQIYQNYNISEALLEKLVDARLLRAEPNTAGGFSYELCHDTLVAPILKAKTKRVAKERAEAERLARLEEEERQKAVRRRERRRLFTIIAIFGVAAAISLLTALWAINQRQLAEAAKAELELSNEELEKREGQLELANQEKERERKNAESKAEEAERERKRAEDLLEVVQYERDLSIRQYRRLLDEAEWLNKENLSEKEFNESVQYLLQQMRGNAEIDPVFSSMRLATNAMTQADINPILALHMADKASKLHQNQLSANILPELTKNLITHEGLEADLEDYINDVHVSPDRKRIAVLSGARILLMDSDLNTLDSISIDNWYDRPRMCFSPDGRYLGIYSRYNTKVQILDLVSEDSLSFEEKVSGIDLMAFSPDGSKILTANRNEQINMWDLKGNLLKTLPVNFGDHGNGSFSQLEYDDRGNHILVVFDQHAFILNLQGEILKKIPESTYIQDLKDERVNSFIVFDNSGNINVWKMSGLEVNREFKKSALSQIDKGETLEDLSPGQGHYLFKDYNGNFIVWNSLDKLPNRLILEQNVVDIAFLSDEHLFSFHGGGSIYRWPVRRSEENAGSIMKNLPSLTFSEKLRNNLVNFEEIQRSANQEERLEAAKYYRNYAYGNSDFYEKAIQLDPANPASYSARGLNFFNQGSFQKAIPDFKKALELDPLDNNSLQNLAASYYNLRDYDNSIKYYEELFERAPGNTTALYQTGLAYYNKAQYSNAIKLFDAAYQVDSNYTNSLYSKGYTLAQLDNFEEAMTAMETGLKRDSYSTTFYRGKAFVYQEMEEYEKAFQWYQKALEISPNEALVFLDLGIVRSKQGLFFAAVQYFKKALEINPAYYDATFQLADIYYRYDRFEESTSYYNSLLNTTYDHVAKNGLGLLSEKQGDEEKAKSYYKAANLSDPGEYYSLIHLGRVNRRSGNLKEAEKNFKKALDIAPHFSFPYIELSWLYQEQKKKRDAEQAYQNFLSSEQEPAEQLYTWASTYAGFTYYEEAISLMDRAIELEPANVKYLTELGRIYDNWGVKEPALDAYEKALKIDPENQELLYRLGLHHYFGKNYQEAIQNFEKILNQNSNKAHVYYYLGFSHSGLGESEKFEDNLKKALTVDTTYTYAWYELGVINYNRKNYGEAADCFYQTIKYNPDYADAYNYLGNCFKNTGKGDAAKTIYQEAIRRDSTIKYPYYNLAGVLMDERNYEGAQRMLEKSMEIDPMYAVAYTRYAQTVHQSRLPWEEKIRQMDRLVKKYPNKYAYVQRANLYNQNQYYEKALVDIKKTLELDPDFSLAYEIRGIAYELGYGEYQLALEAYQKALSAIQSGSDSSPTVEANLYSRLAGVYSSLNNNKEAAQNAEEAYKKQKSSPFYDGPALAQYCGNLSFYLLFDKRFGDAQKYALEGFEADPTQLWIRTNLSTAYLFSGQKEEAMKIYREMRCTPYTMDDRYQYFNEVFLVDLDDLEAGGVIPAPYQADVEEVRAFLRGACE